MDGCGDFTKWLGADMSCNIFMHLDDPSDLARVCLVSRSWHRFVIENGFYKQLCLKMMPEMVSVTNIIEVNIMIEPVNVEHGDYEWECLKRNHRVYAILTRGLDPSLERSCISRAISASSTDNYPEESVQHTLNPQNEVQLQLAYWSSKGQYDPLVPEQLFYKLKANLCLITEIHILPFQACFQHHFPIYSSKAVRFKLGFLKSATELENQAISKCAATCKLMYDNVVWTYTSPEFPMAQKYCMQKFKLPEPVLCIGGILQVELLGRVQRQQIDGLFYLCISSVKAIGRPLLPLFNVTVDPSGKCRLNNCPRKEQGISPTKKATGASSFRRMAIRLVERGVRSWENVILNSWLG